MTMQMFWPLLLILAVVLPALALSGAARLMGALAAWATMGELACPTCGASRLRCVGWSRHEAQLSTFYQCHHCDATLRFDAPSGWQPAPATERELMMPLPPQ